MQSFPGIPAPCAPDGGLDELDRTTRNCGARFDAAEAPVFVQHFGITRHLSGPAWPD
jgi:hypothetical protein